MNHWSRIVSEILKSKSGNLKDLARLSGSNIQDFYKYQSLKNCDLRGQDLSGFDLTGCEIEYAIIDKWTVIDPEFDPRETLEPDYFNFEIPIELNKAVFRLSDQFHYLYKVWAYKHLIDNFRRNFERDQCRESISAIRGNKSLSEVVFRDFSGNTDVVRILITGAQIDALDSFSIKYPYYDAASFSLLSGMLNYHSNLSARKSPASLRIENIFGF